jgi:hypothetical protein
MFLGDVQVDVVHAVTGELVAAPPIAACSGTHGMDDRQRL